MGFSRQEHWSGLLFPSPGDLPNPGIEPGASLVAQLVKNPPAMRENWVQSLGWEDPLETERLPTPVFWPGEFHKLLFSECTTTASKKSNSIKEYKVKTKNIPIYLMTPSPISEREQLLMI